VALVLGLDLLWSLGGGSSASIAYGLVDEPAHLATCAIALLAVAAIAPGRLSPWFFGAALLASVLIDLDHIPGYLGWNVLSEGTPRPYTHGILLVALLLLAARGVGGRRRSVALGIAFGVGAHLFRDIASGSGIAPFWPVSEASLTIDYALYCGLLGLLAGAAALDLRRRRSEPGRPALGGARAGGAVAVLAALLLSVGAGVAERADASQVAIGVYIPGSDWEPERLDDYATAVGRQPAIVPLYRDWSSQPFEEEVLGPIAARGAIPMVTWEPWREWREPVSLAAIAAGHEDHYIAEAARAAAAWGGPIFVRFAHEMNGSWYPWGRWVNGNTPPIYRAAWRQVVAIFRQAGAHNVRWVWTPYVNSGGKPFARFYPGDKWVDWAGFDGFNWGEKFVSFAKLFERSYREMVELTSKPLIVAETGSVEEGGNKAIWIRRALHRTLPRYRHIRALVWWSDVHPARMRGDVRLDTSPAALEAWAWALQAPQLGQGGDFLLATPSWLTRRR
jgi:membrane-bound metal-dependent hydrolase YbcI (DUF457 family)